MRILFVNTLAEPENGGGAETILWEQIRGLSALGHQCILLATSATPGLIASEVSGVRIWHAGIRNIYWPTNKSARPSALLRTVWHGLDGYNIPMQRFVRRVLAHERPDVVSLHNLAGWSAATCRTAASFGMPMVYTLHDYYLLCVKTSMRNAAGNCGSQCLTCLAFRLPHRWLSEHVAAVVGVSQFILDQHVSRGYFKAVPYRLVIRNARDPEALGLGSVRDQLERPGLRFGFMGALSPVKGVAVLVDAFLSTNMPDASLWIAGDGKADYERGLRRDASSKSIVFKGRMKPHEFFAQVDVVVVPSLWHDNLPGVVFEALAFGKPVIAARRGGIPEMVQDGYNGLLFEPDAKGALAACLRALHGDDELRARLTANAKPSSRPFVDFDGWIGQYERLYEEVAAVGVSA